MVRFARAAGSGIEVRKGTEVFCTLMAEASASWNSEIRASRLGRLFRSNGALYVYESEQAFTSGAKSANCRRLGVVFLKSLTEIAHAKWFRASATTSCVVFIIRAACTPLIHIV